MIIKTTEKGIGIWFPTETANDLEQIKRVRLILDRLPNSTDLMREIDKRIRGNKYEQDQF